MKKIRNFGVILSIALVACHSEDKPKHSTATGVTLDDVKHDTQNAVHSVVQAASTTATYLGQTQEEYIRALEAKVAAVNAEMSKRRQEIGRLPAEAKHEAEKALSALEKQRDQLQKQLDAVKAGTADRWDEAKQKLQTTADALDAARKTFEEKMR